MSNLKLKEDITKVAVLYGRLQELEEAKMYIGSNNQYYQNRRRTLKEAIEKALRAILGLSAPKTPKKVLVLELEPEQYEVALRGEEVVVSKELITKGLRKADREETPLDLLAELFGKKAQPGQDIEQYLVTTIEGLLR